MEPVSCDYESLLQNELSSLGALPDLTSKWNVEEVGNLCNWLWQVMSNLDVEEEMFDSNGGSTPKPIENSWLVHARRVANVLPKLSPFELHSVATQSCVFSVGSTSHLILCLLLCSYALRKCPSPIEKRWKRWQSLVGETIRLFQTFAFQENSHALPLWVQYVCPACQHTIEQLPSSALSTALLSGLVGTMSKLVPLECTLQNDSDCAQLENKLFRLLQPLDSILTLIGQNEFWLWCNPWRVRHPISNSSEKYQDFEFAHFRDDIAWWNRVEGPREEVAGMDTSWDELGISLLAMIAYDSRPLVLSSDYTWRIWFPHVPILLRAWGDRRFTILDMHPLNLLGGLIASIPEHFFKDNARRGCSTVADSPFEVFQLLSNRIVVNPQLQGSKLMEAKSNSSRIVNLMKKLLARYRPTLQIRIIRKVVDDCPHTGLKATFLDLLRPLVLGKEGADELWTYVQSFIQDLFSHLDGTKRELVKADELIDKVELYVGVITMIQLSYLVNGVLPEKLQKYSYDTLHSTLLDTLKAWKLDINAMPPDYYYRLNLLEDSLRQIL